MNTVASAEQVTWVLESNVFANAHASLKEAVSQAGQRWLEWDDEWWQNRRWPRFNGEVVVFHGSLGNAERIHNELTWQPGAYCNTGEFLCSAWYPRAKKWLLHKVWQVLPARTLVEQRDGVLKALGNVNAVFVRPDSPLKPFAGRVLEKAQISLGGLDHGFYFDDELLPVLVAQVRDVKREWRYVIVDRRVVAGSAYTADGRTALPDDPRGEPWRFASKIATELDPPEIIYVMDVCEAEDQLWLLELNPFSGADLYACCSEEIVRVVTKLVTTSGKLREMAAEALDEHRRGLTGELGRDQL